MKDWSEILQRLDEEIRSGRGTRARAELSRIARRRVPRPHVARLAQLGWRANVPSLGLRVLGPFVRPHRRVPARPTAEETAEYAHCLIRIGAPGEALELLGEIASARLPQAWLYEASAHVSRWDYAQALPLLEKYAKHGAVPVYARLVGKVNVAACLVALRRHRDAKGLLRELLYELSLRRHFLLHGNALELSAQNFALQGQWRDVEQCLSRAETTLAEAGTADAFYVRKWRAIAGVIRQKADATSLAALHEIRSMATADGEWEAVRQCDEFEATCARNERLLVHLYFGTPFESFRRRLVDDYGPVTIPDEYAWRPDGQGKGDAPALDLATGDWRGKPGPLVPGSLLARLFSVLATDFYRPFRPAALHQGVYPGEIYRPDTSPFRIYEGMKRLRQALEKADIPLTVLWADGAYRLKARSPCAVRLRRRPTLTRWALAVERLRAKWPAGTFSVNEASELLAMNPRTVLRWCEQAREEGTLERTGKGPQVRFGFPAAGGPTEA